LARPNAFQPESGRLFYRRCLLFLVTGLAVLVVAFAVLMAFQMIFFALGDAFAVRILSGIAVACLVLLVVDVLLLVGVLGMQAVQDPYEVRRPPNDQRDGTDD
jgi:hypothetical protein